MSSCACNFASSSSILCCKRAIVESLGFCVPADLARTIERSWRFSENFTERNVNRALDVRAVVLMRGEHVDDLLARGERCEDSPMVNLPHRLSAHFRKRRERNRHNFLAGAGSDSGGVDFVTTFAIRRASRDVSNQVVAVADYESVSKVRIVLEREPELDKQLAGNSDQRQVSDSENGERGCLL